MNRRDALTALVALGAAAGPRLTWSQTSSSLPTLGVLSSGDTLSLEQWKKSRFTIRLKELGWVEGKNLLVERAYDEGLTDRLPAIAAVLVRKRVDVIHTAGPEAAVAAARATKTIPIVFWGVTFPVEQELIDSYAHPGRNVTGVAWNASRSWISSPAIAS